MSTTKKRAYNSQGRQAQAAQTKDRILASAAKLFQKVGFESVTIDSIAQAAEVSVPTVYALFQSKRGILHAVLDKAISETGYEDLVAAGAREKSGKKRLMITAKISRQMYDKERDQIDALRGASVLGPEFKELERERERRRYDRQEEAVKTFAAAGHLVAGMSVSKARDLIWAFTGRDFYRMLVMERGWSSDHYEKWLAELLIKSLLKVE